VNEALDRAAGVRPGEELPVEPLGAWLREHLPDLASELRIEQFPGGHSNLTYLLRLGERELVLRRPPFGSKVKTAHDMGREYKVLSRLHGSYPKAPRALAVCDDPAVIGVPFYVMERVRGVILRGQRPPRGVELPPERMRRLSEALVDGLAELHAVGFRAAGLADLGHPEGYAERQVRGWSERWRAARTDEVPGIDRAAAWLADHLPPDSGEAGAALLHNDFKYDNLVLSPDLSGIVAVLDWEMATVGDPLMDLGTSLGYWVDADDPPEMRTLPVGPTALPGNLTRAELVERYAARTGREVSGILFYYVFGLLKVAVIAQQIYYRYRQGLTRDERFAALLGSVRLLGDTAARALDRGRIDRLGA
jgi:aminoglycoside phosphotransferase (APT) family kinase protein